MMASNRLTDHQRATSKLLGLPLFAAGSVGWPGAYGGWWQADPNDGSVLIFLAHSMVEMNQLAKGIGLGVWSAITEFQALGSDSQRARKLAGTH
jgi:hypothetical protein